MVQFGILPLRIPFAIVLTDVGRKSGGATLAEVSQQVWGEVMKAAGQLGDQFNALGGLMGEAAGKATTGVSKAATDANKVVGKAAKDVGEAVGKVTEGTGKAVGKVTEGAGKAVGSGVKAAEDGAKKALDSIKSLW